MYTGIVETTASVLAVDLVGDGCRIRIETRTEDIDLEIEREESIAVDGVCLTADLVTESWIEAVCSPETIARTTLADRSAGDQVNLERPLPANGRFHGHVVTGTVDTTTEIVAVDTPTTDHSEPTDEGASEGGRELTIAIPSGYDQYVVEKGSVALDGISLTVASVDDTAGTFRVATVPTTESVTTLSELNAGDSLHFEADVLAKYVTRATERAN